MENLGLILPEGSIPRKKLSGENLSMEIITISPEDGDNVIVKYPDGYQHHHQAIDMESLLCKVNNVLKYRYNIDSFSFESIPAFEVGSTIKIKDINYGS